MRGGGGGTQSTCSLPETSEPFDFFTFAAFSPSID